MAGNKNYNSHDDRWDDSDEIMELLAHLVTIEQVAQAIFDLNENPSLVNLAIVTEESYVHSETILREAGRLKAKLNSVRSIIEANIRKDYE
jgi:hypothetical protein